MTISRNAIIPSPTLAKSNLFNSTKEGPGLELLLPPKFGDIVVTPFLSGGDLLVGVVFSVVVVNGGSSLGVCVVRVIGDSSSSSSVVVSGGGQSVVVVSVVGGSSVVVGGTVIIVGGCSGLSQALRQSSSE